MEKLTPKQERAFQLILDNIKALGYPPTLQELTHALGCASRNTAIKYLSVLARKGYILWERNKARGIQVLEDRGVLAAAEEVQLPLVGTVTAGLPMLAEENVERYIAVPSYLLVGSGRHFLLRVDGKSMQNAGILDGDLVIVRSQTMADSGQVVVALIEGDATVKRLVVKEGVRYLKAENPAFTDIFPERDWSVQGRVVALMRETVE
ncbi:transcriptional repressor LexA [candidate division KSB1 bacterium]|nr:transcriptional repressor LexA [candidate division KSB1 bacterium]